jgi:16S rRNA (uracil1498-N3)-methyltransferase
MRANYTLPRLWIDGPIDGEVPLNRDQAHYLGTVLRKQEGDHVRLFNGRDGEWSAIVTSASRKAMQLKGVECLREQTAVPDIRLLFAPLKRQRTATIIEKATELGVRTLQPILTERTQYPKMNLERARSQAIEAAEQTERLDIPDILAPVALTDILNETRPLIFADEAGDALPVMDEIMHRVPPIDLLIGPEGGFTTAERDQLRARPAVSPVHLGPRILRADTAAISLLTLVQAQIGDWLQK